METNGCPTDSTSDMDLVNLEDSNNYTNYLSDMPAQIEKHLDFVTANENGHILLGSSNLTGRYWCGSVWYYKEPSLAPDIEGSQCALEFTGGVTDGAFIDEKRAVIGQDGGLIDFVTIKDSEGCCQIERTDQIEDHGYSILSVKVTCNAKAVITASMDMGIRLWDCHTTACTHNFTPAHTQEVTSIAPHPKHPDLFLSSSLDGNAFIWDLRLPKPASCVFRDIDNCPSAISWVHSDSIDPLNYFVGTLNGEVLLRDTKVLSESIVGIESFKRPIFRITPNRFRPNQMAVCANETRVQVFSLIDEKIKRNYCDDRHMDFVRGLEWLSEGTLLSCGWDTNVLTHKINLENASNSIL